MSTPTLAETQALLWKLITAPEGVAKGLDDLGAAERRVAHSLVRPRSPLSAVERWDIYANMYFYRLRDCLKDDFAAVAGVIGDADFHNLITDYLLAHPPRHFSLRYAGERLPDFLQEHELSRRRPFLADLARLEYAIVDSFDAADVVALTPDELQNVQAEEWPGLHLLLSPSARLLQLEWPAGEIWEDAKQGREPEAIAAQPTHIRVWRKQLRVFHKIIDPSEAVALAELERGRAFGEVCEAVGDAEAVVTMLRVWLADELLCRSGEGF